MDTILVDNKNIQEVFHQMLCSTFQQYRPTRVLCLSARSGKGKSTIVNYFSEYCQEYAALPIRIDFDAFHISDELELIDAIIDQFSTFLKFGNAFFNYKESIKRLALTSAGDTVIQNVNLRQTQIGTIHIQKGGHGASAQLTFIENAFFQDLKDVAQSYGQIVFLLDAFECASINIKEWVRKKLILSKSLGPKIIVVVAGQEDLEFSEKIECAYGIKAFHLPDAYRFEDWIEYGRQLKIADVDTIKKCYSYWKGDPFYMCVSLKPFANGENI